MNQEEILIAVNGLLGIAFRLYESAGQIQGDLPIPSWDEISSKNALLQAKIDAEK